MFERLPRSLQQQPLLRIHRQRLTRTNPKEPRIEPGRVGEEPALTRVRHTHRVRVRVEQALQIPASVGGELPHHIRTRRQQVPQRGRAVHTTRQPHPHTHDRHRLVRRRRRGRVRECGRFPGHLGGQEVAQSRRGRVVEKCRDREVQPGQRDEPIPEGDGPGRVQAEVLERPLPVEHVVPDGGGDLAMDQVAQGLGRAGHGQPVVLRHEPGDRHRGARGTDGGVERPRELGGRQRIRESRAQEAAGDRPGVAHQ